QAPAPTAPNAGGGAQPAPAGPGTPVTTDGTAGSIAGDPGADLYPQPPVDPATTPQARLVAQLSDVEHRVQYLRNVLARSRADLAAAQARLGVVPQLITYLAAPNPPSPGLRASPAAPVL